MNRREQKWKEEEAEWQRLRDETASRTKQEWDIATAALQDAALRVEAAERSANEAKKLAQMEIEAEMEKLKNDLAMCQKELNETRRTAEIAKLKAEKTLASTLQTASENEKRLQSEINSLRDAFTAYKARQTATERVRQTEAKLAAEAANTEKQIYWN